MAETHLEEIFEAARCGNLCSECPSMVSPLRVAFDLDQPSEHKLEAVDEISIMVQLARTSLHTFNVLSLSDKNKDQACSGPVGTAQNIEEELPIIAEMFAEYGFGLPGDNYTCGIEADAIRDFVQKPQDDFGSSE